MASNVYITAIGLACLAGLNCADVAGRDAHQALITDLNAQMEVLREQVQKVEAELKKERLKRFLAEAERDVVMTPGSVGYAPIHTMLGVLTVQLVNIEPYATGARVTIKFGNPTSASINGAKAYFTWGTTNAEGAPDYTSAKSREIAFSKVLPAGAWTNVQVVLESLPAADLGFVGIRGITYSSISLLQ